MSYEEISSAAGHKMCTKTHKKSIKALLSEKENLMQIFPSSLAHWLIKIDSFE
jgi:hypothetical protein